MTDFKDWLAEEIDRRGWSHSELARRAGVSQVTVSGIIAGSRRPGCDFCVKIAGALSLSPVLVLIKAGILPPQDGDMNLTVKEITEIARQLPPDAQEEILAFVRFKLQQNTK